jgi:integrase
MPQNCPACLIKSSIKAFGLFSYGKIRDFSNGENLNDPVQTFLESLKPGTRAIYTYGLKEFQQFYQPQGTVSQFIDLVQIDLKQTDWKEKQKVAQNTLRDFSAILQVKGLAPTSVRSYVSSVQSMLKFYLEVKVALFTGTVPPSVTLSRPYPWTLQTINKFIESMTDPMYRSFASLVFQSGLGIREAFTLTYQDIQEEYEKNVCPLCLDFGIKTRKKTTYPFLTFIGSWALEKLKVYLNTQTLTPDLRLYPISREAADSYFRATAKPFLGHWTGRCPMRPHSFRTALKTINTDSKAIDRLYIEFFMGHAKPGKHVEDTYISKTREAWRTEYKKLERFLDPRINEDT